MATATVTGDFDVDGAPGSGTVTFRRREYLLTADDDVLAPSTTVATLNGSGEISQVLRTTNTTGDRVMGASSWLYHVTVELDGQEKQVGYMELTGNVDLADVMATWPERP